MRVFRSADASDRAGPGGRTGVLVLSGWMSGKNSYRRYGTHVAAAAGSVVVTLDLRGHGDSSGTLDELSRADHLRDVATAYDYLAGQPDVSDDGIIVCGASYGGYLAVRLTGERAVPRLVLRAPAAYPDAGFDQPTKALIDADPHVFRLPKDRAAREAPRQVELAARYPGPVLMILSGNDTEVPRETTDIYREAFGARARGTLDLNVIEGADHVLTPEQKIVFADILIGWMKQMPAGRRKASGSP